jgi:hypothetical protein
MDVQGGTKRPDGLPDLHSEVSPTIDRSTHFLDFSTYTACHTAARFTRSSRSSSQRLNVPVHGFRFVHI